MPVNNVLSTPPGTEFSLALFRDLRNVGATEAKAHAYALGVREGGVLAFATGSPNQIRAALEIMNSHKPRKLRIDRLEAHSSQRGAGKREFST
jgi:hypothetical protein